LRTDPGAVIDYYLAHRGFRERQIVDRLARGAVDPAEIVREIYAGVDRGLWPFAEQSTRAALEKLRREGTVELRSNGTAQLSA
jgi:hypothetical protein